MENVASLRLRPPSHSNLNSTEEKGVKIDFFRIVHSSFGGLQSFQSKVWSGAECPLNLPRCVLSLLERCGFFYFNMFKTPLDIYWAFLEKYRDFWRCAGFPRVVQSFPGLCWDFPELCGVFSELCGVLFFWYVQNPVGHLFGHFRRCAEMRGVMRIYAELCGYMRSYFGDMRSYFGVVRSCAELCGVF